MKTIRINNDWKTYRIDLTDDGEPIEVAIEIAARGKATTERRLWAKRYPFKPMTQRVKDVLNTSGTMEMIAEVCKL